MLANRHRYIAQSGWGNPATKLTEDIFSYQSIRLEEKIRVCCLDVAEVNLL
jgi:hypothetical protein